MRPYSSVHTGPNTCGGGRRGGWRSARYVLWVSFGRVEKPTAVPAAMGRRIAAAGCSKVIAGSSLLLIYHSERAGEAFKEGFKAKFKGGVGSAMTSIRDRH
ncbi:hypothetical protein KC329_g98 [Hortaea werneckii]|nr:hypothetical protein KC329_g98 [Hortaea werneckii]